MTTEHLPGKPGVKLTRAWAEMDADKRAAFLPHLLGDTSAEYLAWWLERAGTSVSASTIRTYRRALARENQGEPCLTTS